MLEKVYENSLAWELNLRGIKVSSQKEFRIIYREKEVGTYYADLVADEKIIVEVKSVDTIDAIHRAQLLNYLRISGLRIGLLVNIARPRLTYERLVV